MRFSSYGAIVGGAHNNASGPYSGGLGYGNHSGASYSSVTGGSSNTASGSF